MKPFIFSKQEPQVLSDDQIDLVSGGDVTKTQVPVQTSDNGGPWHADEPATDWVDQMPTVGG